MQERVIHFLADRFATKSKVESKAAKTFVEEVLSEPVETYTIFRDLFGVQIADKTRRVVLGPFVVVHYPTQRDSVLDPLSPAYAWKRGMTSSLPSACQSRPGRQAGLSQRRTSSLSFLSGFFGSSWARYLISKSVS